MPLEFSLVLGFTPERYNVGTNEIDASRREGKEIYVDVQKVHEVVSSKFYWAYAKMVLLLSQFITTLMHFAESCRCHFLRLQTPAYLAALLKDRKRFQRQVQRAARIDCIFKGCRAPECADGHVDGLVTALHQIAEQEILMICRGLGAEDMRKVLGDFHLGTGYIAKDLVEKNSFWKNALHFVHILAHHLHDRIRAGIERMRGLVAAYPGELPPLLRLLFGLASPLEHEMISLYNGDDSPRPNVTKRQDKLPMTLLSLRPVEERHSRSNLTLKRITCHSAATISFELRAPQLEFIMDEKQMSSRFFWKESWALGHPCTCFNLSD